MKNIQLSKRLKFVADFITSGYVLADIGTDHGFIPIHMVLEGKTPRAYGMDINKGPLSRADEHIKEAGLEDKIETRLSDGLEKLQANEAETVLIAGMGGSLIIKILTEGEHALHGVKELVLSPHTEADLVREFLMKSDFIIIREGMVVDAGKYYVVLKARRRTEDDVEGVLYANATDVCLPSGVTSQLFDTLCIKYGKLLLQEKNPVLKEFLKKEKNTYNIILSGLKNNESEAGIKRKEEIEEILRQIEAAIIILEKV